MDRLLTSKQSLWEALERRGVVLVVGPEAVQVELSGERLSARVPFYTAVAEELLAAYNATVPERSGFPDGSPWMLHRAVAQILANSGNISVERLRRSVSTIVKSLSSQVVAAPLLTRLAKLGVFDLFICLTPDDCLVGALHAVLGEERVHVSAYAPNADSSQVVDIPPPSANAARVFFPLGRSALGSRVAIHEEDALEFLYKFQEEGLRRAPNLLTELRSRDLLLLGCNLPDWLGRGFLRLANESRLSSQERKMEFFAADAQDPTLNAFLSRFDPNASVFPWSPEEFINELEQIAEPGVAPPPRTGPAPAHATTRSSGPTVFVSYASEDAAAAARLAQSLAQLGFADVWLDRRKLVAGDDWSDRIDEALERCDFFIPVLSHQANQRREGVFWEEWRKALGRAMRVNGAFLLPVGIDDTPPDRAGYDRIFSGFTLGFKQLHLLHAPDGALSDAGRVQLQTRCREFLGDARG